MLMPDVHAGLRKRPEQQAPQEHTVLPGETSWTIANTHGVGLPELRKANKNNAAVALNALQEGQTVLLPPTCVAPAGALSCAKSPLEHARALHISCCLQQFCSHSAFCAAAAIAAVGGQHGSLATANMAVLQLPAWFAPARALSHIRATTCKHIDLAYAVVMLSVGAFCAATAWAVCTGCRCSVIPDLQSLARCAESRSSRLSKTQM